MKLRRNSLGSDPLAAFAPIIAVTLALLLGGVMLLALGKNPVEAYLSMLDGAFGGDTRIFNTINRAIPLLLVAVGICIAFRGGVINIGAEGQLLIGAACVTAATLALGESLPALIFVPLALLIGFGGGALWGAVPGYLKAHFDVNEILSTIMMNEIAIQFVIFLLSGPMIDPEQIALGTRIAQSAAIPESAWLARLAPPARLHAGIFLALIAAIIVYVLLWRTVTGYRIRAVGQSRAASLYAGISVPTYLTLAMVLSGGLAGLAGASELMGVNHRMLEGFAVGYGFSGIVVALFGRLHPLGVIPSSLFFAALLTGAERMQRELQVPSATITVLQGLVVLFVVSSEVLVRRRAARRAAQSITLSTSTEQETTVQQAVSGVK